MLAQHVVRLDPRSVTTAVLNQLVILLVHNRTINVVNSLQLLGKNKINETCTFVVGNVKGSLCFRAAHLCREVPWP